MMWFLGPPSVVSLLFVYVIFRCELPTLVLTCLFEECGTESCSCVTIDNGVQHHSRGNNIQCGVTRELAFTWAGMATWYRQYSTIGYSSGVQYVQYPYGMGVHVQGTHHCERTVWRPSVQPHDVIAILPQTVQQLPACFGAD